MDKIDHQIGVGDLRLTQKEKDYVNDVLDNNRLSYGPYSKKFEELMAKHHGVKFAILCNSGTSALRVAVAALKEKFNWKDGDEVLVPALTFVATSNVLIQQNIKPVFVDVEPDYYGIDPDKIEGKITSRTKAVMVVHLFGMPCEMDKIIAIAKKHDLRIIEDTCETMFAKYKGKPVGSFSDISCFSTYAAHILVTGVGGLAMTNDPELAVMLRSLINHGRDSIYLTMDDDKTTDPDKLFKIVARRFKFIRLGYSFRVTEMEAAIGVGQLEQKDFIINKRKENAAFFTDKLKKFGSLQLPKIRKDAEHVFMMYPIVIKKGSSFTKEELVNFLESNNIETRDMLPLINQPVYEKLFGKIEDHYPVAKHINNNGFYIGCHQHLTKQELEYIVKKFEEFFDKRRS